MTDTTPENISIYLGAPSHKDNVLNGASPHEKYIILMNDTLQADNRKLTGTVTDLESQITELETDSDRMEKSKTYMKGLLKNFVEITRWYMEIDIQYETIISGIINDIKTFKYKAIRHLRILQSMMIIFMAIWYEYHTISVFLPVLGVVTIILAFQESTLWNLNIRPYKSNMDKIKELSKEINDAEAAQDYIHVLIDHQ